MLKPASGAGEIAESHRLPPWSKQRRDLKLHFSISEMPLNVQHTQPYFAIIEQNIWQCVKNTTLEKESSRNKRNNSISTIWDESLKLQAVSGICPDSATAAASKKREKKPAKICAAFALPATFPASVHPTINRPSTQQVSWEASGGARIPPSKGMQGAATSIEGPQRP